MALSSFESLPQETLQQICAYLDQKTQWAFAVTSRTCNAVAHVHLFQTIRVRVLLSHGMRSDIDRWKRILDRTSAYQKVRCLILEDRDWSCHPIPRDPWRWPGHVREVVDAAPDLSFWSEDDLLVPDLSRSDSTGRSDETWQPLADFVLQLAGLRSVVYKCSAKMPKCLETVLHQTYPGCSVHISKLNECSMTTLGRSINTLTPTIIPQVRSVSLRIDTFETEYDLGQTCLRKILDRAPNMHDVGVDWYLQSPQSIPNHLETLENQQQKYLSENAHKILPSTSVRKLRLKSPTGVYPVHLEFFSYHIDLATIKVLKIDGLILPQTLDWAADNCRFASLEVLVLNSRPVIPRWDLSARGHYHISLPRFLRSLPPLQQIRICGTLDHNIVAAILQHHGQSLHRLWLENFPGHSQFVFSRSLIAEIQRTCPVLEGLKIPILRSGGSLDEVYTYRELGTLKKLRDLWIVLETDELPGRSELAVPDADFDDFDLQPFANIPIRQDYPPNLLNGHVRNALIDSAVDEELARAIFDAISKNKTSDAVPLDSLGVLPMVEFCRGRRALVRGYPQILENLSRWWLLVRDPRDTHRQEIHAKEIGQDISFSSWKHDEELTPEESLAAVFSRLWPGSQENKFWWRDNWHSLPLASVT